MLPVDEIRLNFNPASLVALNVVLGFLMFGIALDTRVADFRRVLRMPGAMAVGVAAQFIVLPAVTFVLTLLLKPGPSIALGMILVSSCPAGHISNFLVHYSKGNTALSVSVCAMSSSSVTAGSTAWPLSVSGFHHVACVSHSAGSAGTSASRSLCLRAFSP